MTVPVTMTSAAMIEGTPFPRPVRCCCLADGCKDAGCCNWGCCWAAIPASASLVFENILSCPDESARISDDAVVPNLVVEMRSCAAPCRSQRPYHVAFVHTRTHRQI